MNSLKRRSNICKLWKIFYKAPQQCCLCSRFRFAESAVVFAQTQASFEEIALKFFELPQTDALTAFLKRKLENLDAKVLIGSLVPGETFSD